MRLSLFHPLLAAAWIVSALPSAPDVQPSRVRVPGAFIFELEDGQVRIAALMRTDLQVCF